MSTKKRRIGLILPANAEYPDRLIEGAMEYAAEHPGIALVDEAYIGQWEEPGGGEPSDLDGALVWPNRGDTWVRRLQDEGVNVVSASGEMPPGVEELPRVAFDDTAMVDAAASYLAGLGREQTSYVGCETGGSRTFRQRLEQFSKQCEELGMACGSHDLPRIEHMENHLTRLPDADARSLQAFLLALPKPASVWCEEDHLARLVCRQAKACGISIPEDLAVLGVGDYRVAQMGSPPLSTIPQPGQLVGCQAMELIHRMIRGEPELPGMIKIPPPPVAVRDSTETASQADEHFRQIHDWMVRHACEGITVEEVMSLMPMSQRQFSKRFTELFGRTPGAEIRRLRCERAKHYLRTTNFSIERIAKQCGYEEPSSFSNFFKRETGTTPKAYRRGSGANR